MGIIWIIKTILLKWNEWTDEVLISRKCVCRLSCLDLPKLHLLFMQIDQSAVTKYVRLIVLVLSGLTFHAELMCTCIIQTVCNTFVGIVLFLIVLLLLAVINYSYLSIYDWLSLANKACLISTKHEHFGQSWWRFADEYQQCSMLVSTLEN